MEESINLILLGGIDDIRKHGGRVAKKFDFPSSSSIRVPLVGGCFNFFQEVQPT